MGVILFIKKYEKWTTITPIHVYINRINNRLVFKIKYVYKLELQIPETMKLFGSKLIGKTKNGKNVKNFEAVEVAWVLCKSLKYYRYTFTHNESYVYLLNIEPSNLVFLKTYNLQRVSKQTCIQHWIRRKGVQVSQFLSLIVGKFSKYFLLSVKTGVRLHYMTLCAIVSG